MEAPPSTGWSGKHAVELYVRTYTTMLQSSGEIKVDSLVQTHIRMGSVLHPLAGQPQSDMGALLYAARRLPRAIEHCRHVVMGQSSQGFKAVLGADSTSVLTNSTPGCGVSPEVVATVKEGMRPAGRLPVVNV